MIALSLAEIAEIVGGQSYDIPDPAALVTGPVVIDSREVKTGSLFAAFAGEHVDGHDYAVRAVEAGATAVLAARPVGVPAIVVADVQNALGALARAVVERLGTDVVALTGSAGKTSTKDLIAQVLQHHAPTVWTPGSLNNEIGLPLTALRAGDDTRHLVLEMGARGIGHIRYLTGLTPPRIGLVLNVGTAHIGEFGGREQIAQAKGELVEALPPADRGGVAVLNADDPLVRAMASRTRARVTLFGESDEAAVRAENVRLTANGQPSFKLHTPTGCSDVTLRLYGEHHVSNALAAAAVAHELGMPVEEIATALSEAGTLSRWRMEVTERSDGVTIVNDAYNANPDSMRAALDAVAAMHVAGERWAVLGGMLELGPDSDAEHAAVGSYAASLAFDHVVAVGEGARPLAEAFAGSEWVPDTAAAHDLLAPRLRAGDVVLLKSSRDSGLRWLGDRLAAEGGPVTATPVSTTSGEAVTR